MFRAKSFKICLGCHSFYIPTIGKQKYCGNQKDKSSCSYKQRKYHKGDVKAQRKRYYLKHRARSLRLNKEWKDKLRFEIFKRDDFTCQYCGRKPPEVILEIDHVIPKSLGGKYYRTENLLTACRDCNSGKSNIPLEQSRLAA